jgi:hypothetical protein
MPQTRIRYSAAPPVFQRRLDHVCQLGGRTLASLFDTIITYHPHCAALIDLHLQRYERVTPEVLAAIGGGRWPPYLFAVPAPRPEDEP